MVFSCFQQAPPCPWARGEAARHDPVPCRDHRGPRQTSFDSPSAPSDGRLNAAVALSVALLSAFLGLCDLKAEQNNHWAFYPLEDLNERHEQFELAQAPLTLAIALLAISSLTRRRWLFMAAMVPAFWGLAMGSAGLLGWTAPLHGLARWS